MSYTALAPTHDETVNGSRENAAPDSCDLVSFTLSGEYDEDKLILIDAVDTSRSISRKKARQLVAALAGAFEADSTVCLHLTNDVLYPVLVLAILASRCRWTGTNTAYAVGELEHHFRISGTKYIITTAEHAENVRLAAIASGTRAEVVLFDDLLDGSQSPTVTASIQKRRPYCGREHGSAPRTLRDLLHEPAITDLQQTLKSPSPDDAAALMQTSGTTGLPKIAVRTHRSMISELRAISQCYMGKPHEVRRLFSTPIFHAFSAPEMIFNALRLGHTTYFMRRYDETFAQKVHDLQITETFGAPGMLLKLANQPEERHLLQSLRYVAYGGAALGAGLRCRFLALFEVPPRLVPVYGMTEGGWFTTFGQSEEDDTGSVGRPIPGYEIRISPDGRIESGDQRSVGEVLVRGLQVMEEYLEDAHATIDAFEAGWLKTGDIGYLEHGKLYLVDRAKDMMKVNGWQVSLTELQNVLMQSEDVLEAAVFGMGCGTDEHPVVCLVRKTARVTVDSIKAHLRGSLAGYKVRTCEVLFVDAIPRSPTGKILKEELKRQVSTVQKERDG